jgi:hypothetical protein
MLAIRTITAQVGCLFTRYSSMFKNVNIIFRLCYDRRGTPVEITVPSQRLKGLYRTRIMKMQDFI